jgi:hypothetical protein
MKEGMRTACRSDLVHLPASRAVRSLLVCIVAACAVACGSDYPVESRAPIARDVRVAAVVHDAASTPATFDQVRIVFRRASGAAALDTIIGFAPGASSATVKLSIPLSPNAPATGELLTLMLSCISAARDTVYKGGPAIVLLSAFVESPPVIIVLWPTGVVPLDSIPVVGDTVHLVPFAISAFSGDGQTGLVGALLGAPLRIARGNRSPASRSRG